MYIYMYIFWAQCGDFEKGYFNLSWTCEVIGKKELTTKSKGCQFSGWKWVCMQSWCLVALIAVGVQKRTFCSRSLNPSRSLCKAAEATEAVNVQGRYSPAWSTRTDERSMKGAWKEPKSFVLPTQPQDEQTITKANCMVSTFASSFIANIAQ